jgi:hypothetical protein
MHTSMYKVDSEIFKGSLVQARKIVLEWSRHLLHQPQV